MTCASCPHCAANAARQPDLPPVVSAQEYGRRGYLAMVANTTAQQRAAWQKRAGRKPNRTFEEIQAVTGSPKGTRSTTHAKEAGATPNT